MLFNKRNTTHLRRSSRFSLIACLLFISLAGASCSQAKQIDVHDPVMTKSGDRYYLFSTGRGITIYSSLDMLSWKHEGKVFDTQPKWAKAVAPGFNGHLWAPDIVQKDGKFLLYYSVSAFGKNTSGMGVAINKTLDTSSPDYRWEDQGLIVQSMPERDWWNAIDPAVVADKKGDGWMAFGSFWGGLKMVKLDASWTKIAEPQEWYSIAKRQIQLDKNGNDLPQQIEAPFIYPKGDWYYLFVSWGLCCRGDDSTYHLVMGRSKTITGPYLDKNGVSMNKGGGSVFLKGNKRWPGLGHNSVYSFDGKDYTVLHAYESADKGLQKLKILEMTWDNEGWPHVDEADLDNFKGFLSP